MKNLFTLVALSLLSLSVFAADEKADPKMQEMMKAWQEASTPGAPHAVLKGMAGKWKYTSKMWQTPEAVPETSAGTSTFTLIHGGRYLKNESKGKAMGMNYEGLGFIGYNNVAKRYETTWMDNMSTAMMHGSGNFDPATQTLSDSGEFSCPLKKEPQKFRSEWKMVDKNSMIFSMWMPDRTTGKEFRSMELTYRRK